MDTIGFIEFLVRADVLTFGEFVTKAGRSTPYFLNFGRVRTGAQLAALGQAYAARIVDTFGDEVDVLFGPAYKGIPLATATAIAMSQVTGRDVGFCFDRKEVKDHGEGGHLVGHPPADGDRVVIVEDVTTAGTSIRESVPKLRAVADIDLRGLVVAVDRQERAPGSDRLALDQVAADHGLTATAITDIDTIVAQLRDHDVDGHRVIGDDDLARITAYRRQWGA